MLRLCLLALGFLVCLAAAPAGATHGGIQALVSGGDEPSISGDGLFVAYRVGAQIYVRDRAASSTTVVSVSTAGVAGNGSSDQPFISTGGRFVAFRSSATNLVTPDTNAAPDVFLHDRQTATTIRVTQATSGLQANRRSWGPSVSADGRYVAFGSEATNLGGVFRYSAVFLRDVVAATTTMIPKILPFPNDGPAGDPAITADGSAVFAPIGTGTIGADRAVSIIRYDVAAAVSTLVIQMQPPSFDPALFDVSASDDGDRIAFLSSIALDPADMNAALDVYVRDMSDGTTRLQSVSTTGLADVVNPRAFDASISGDGSTVVFSSLSRALIAGDTNERIDVFVRDIDTGTTVRASTTADGLQGDGHSSAADVSGDGSVVAFRSESSTLVPGAQYTVFVRTLGARCASGARISGPATTALHHLAPAADAATCEAARTGL